MPPIESMQPHLVSECYFSHGVVPRQKRFNLYRIVWFNRDLD